MAIIYKITNLINGKIYIGYTKSLSRRYREHRNPKKQSTQLISKAILKYGFVNFNIEKIYENEDAIYTRTIMEPYFIILYNSHFKEGLGYNMSKGGEFENGMTRSPETRLKMSIAAKGKICTDITREKRRLNSTGRKASEETRAKMRAKHIARGCNIEASSKSYKIIYQNSTETEITNLHKFAKDNGYNHSSLYKVMNGKIKIHKNIVNVERL